MLLDLLQDKNKFFENIEFTPFLMQYPSPDFWIKDFSKLDFLETFLDFNIKGLNLYIHIPFCDYLCAYCSFSKILKNDKYIDLYLQKLDKELDFWNKIINFSKIEIKTIFIGWWTPTVLDKKYIQKLWILLKKYHIRTNWEFSIETNPDRIDENFLYWKEIWVNRISIGQQTFNEKILKSQNRNYINFQEFTKKIDFLRKIGFDNINIDMIYGFDKLNTNYKKILQDDINKILKINPEHISLYPLILYYKHLDNLQLADFFEDLEKQYEFVLENLSWNYDFYTLEYAIKNWLNNSFQHIYQVNYLKWENVLWIWPSGFSFIESLWFKNYFHLKNYLETNFFPEYAYFLDNEDINYKRKFILQLRLNSIEKKVIDYLLEKKYLYKDDINKLFEEKNDLFILKSSYRKYQDLLLYYFNQKFKW